MNDYTALTQYEVLPQQGGGGVKARCRRGYQLTGPEEPEEAHSKGTPQHPLVCGRVGGRVVKGHLELSQDRDRDWEPQGS